LRGRPSDGHRQWCARSADIAADWAITKATLHYHFATKEELGRALIARYAERFAEGLAEIDKRADVRTRIWRYVKLYQSVLVRDRMCLCGMFAAEYQTHELRRFFDMNEAWLVGNLEREPLGKPVQGPTRCCGNVVGPWLSAFESPAPTVNSLASTCPALRAHSSAMSANDPKQILRRYWQATTHLCAFELYVTRRDCVGVGVPGRHPSSGWAA
jgi:AcrR family transcriptional regulator